MVALVIDIEIEIAESTCPGCGCPSVGYCSRTCQHKASNNNARTERRANGPIFCGVDGEGITRPDGRHDYVMLSVGDRTLIDPDGLTHHKIFPFLYAQLQDGVAHVGFYLRYDFTMWIRSITKEQATLLFNPDKRVLSESAERRYVVPVHIDGWDIEMLGMKRFQLRPHAHITVKGRCVGCGAMAPKEDKPPPWLYICDAGSFWQTSFLNAINPDKWPTPVCSPEEWEILTAGKAVRGQDVPLDELAAYNVTENIVLARAMSVLAQGFRAAGITLLRSQWYGPGAAVQRWLDRRAHDRLISRKELREVIPAWIRDAFRDSYIAGRFEIPMHGHIPGITVEFDIQSAYPFAMSQLPCLCGEWGNPDTGEPLLIYGTIRGSNPYLGGLPNRDKKGRILFPHVTRGWYFLAEIEAAHRAGLVSSWDMEKAIYYSPCDHQGPLAEMASMFTRRLKVGKATPQGIALKLLLNSAYGKTAQSLGTAKYGNSVYASWITSKCRTMLLDAIGTHPNGAKDVVMMATDAVFFRSDHPHLDTTPNKLGAWERVEKNNLTLFKPGVYWDDKAREGIARGQIRGIKSRGVNGSVMAESIPHLDHAFSVMTVDGAMPEARSNVPFDFLSPVQAIAQNNWANAGRVRTNFPRLDRAELAPKRRDMYRDGDVWRSRPGKTAPDSLPYSKDFGDVS